MPVRASKRLRADNLARVGYPISKRSLARSIGVYRNRRHIDPESACSVQKSRVTAKKPRTPEGESYNLWCIHNLVFLSLVLAFPVPKSFGVTSSHSPFPCENFVPRCKEMAVMLLFVITDYPDIIDGRSRCRPSRLACSDADGTPIRVRSGRLPRHIRSPLAKEPDNFFHAPVTAHRLQPQHEFQSGDRGLVKIALC